MSPQPGADATSAAPSPGAPSPAAPSQGAAPAAGPSAGPSAAPDPKAEREAVVREIQQADPSGSCPATLTSGTVVTCTIDPNATATFSFTLNQPKDLLLVQIAATQWTYPTLLGPDGSVVPCELPGNGGGNGGQFRCATTQAGTYTLKAKDGSGTANSLALSYLPMMSPGACRTAGAADLSLGTPTVFHGSLPVGSAGECYVTADLAAGELLRTNLSDYQFTRSVYDATGRQVCTSIDGNDPYRLDCTTAGQAPFRFLVQRDSRPGLAYDLTLARLSRPEGCLVVQPQAFGVAPDLSPVARCRTLRITEAGPYSFFPVKADGSYIDGELFGPDGKQLFGNCATGKGCEPALGEHTWVVNPTTPVGTGFGLAFRSDRETRGCTATGDTGLVSGPVTGTFGTPGQGVCLTLPTATGNGLYLLDRRPTDGTGAAATVYDAAGVKQCDNGDPYPSAVCKLTGTAPFRAVLGGTPNQAFQLVVHRTGEAAGCAAWPSTGFDGAWGAEITVTEAARQACLALPADKHSTAEMVDYTNTQNRANASFQVVDPQGNVVCSAAGGSAFTCALTAGVPYTALLTNGTWGDTYKLVRRDISAAADCLSPNSTTVGGRSTPVDLNSSLDARCVRVDAAPTDRFWLSARSTADQYGATVQLWTADASGRTVCVQWGTACRVTGASSYTVIVLAMGYQGRTVHSDVDTWRVGTADGWAPECTAHPVSVTGFAPRSGVLTESSTAYCMVLDMKPSQSVDISGVSSAPGLEQPYLSVLSPATWDDSSLTYQCGNEYGRFGGRCMATSNAVVGQAALLVTPARTATPVEYSLQGTGCALTCTPPPSLRLASIGPATGVSGTQTQAVIRGSGLTLGTKVKLVRNGSWSNVQPLMKPLSVNREGTELHVLVDTNRVEPGSYDVILDGYGSGTTGLVKAFTVTAAPAVAKGRFMALPPSRILNTVLGVGAPAGRVGQGGVVPLQVAGAGGVPAAGVTAVVLNVTAVNPTRDSAISVYPSGQAVPDLPTVSFAAGQNVTNLVTVPLSNGKVDLRNAWGEVDLGVDVVGYYTDNGSGSYQRPVSPTRILNTVLGVGAPAGRVGWGGVVPLKVTGVAGVPTAPVTAVVLSVSAVNPSRTSYLAVYPHGEEVPDASSVNFAAGQNVSNLVTVPVGIDGTVDLYNAWGEVDLGVDIVGYYTDSGGSYSASPLVRLLDTRDGTGARAGALGGDGDVVSLKVAGVEGVPATGVTSVLLNVTAVWPTETSFLTVYPHGQERPDASNINYRPGEVVSVLVMVPVVDGRVSFANQWGSVDVVADLIGYFSA
ncbi:hypothetical protein [Kitasatospora sp. NPDC093806]|uniref:hypothetical protein n=1 Tax=Kitasatospora sp. NPDC093806 TaxID=3155075 RepID=UPI00344919A5